MKTLLPVALLLAVLGGCATPQYQTVVRLIPPQDAQGRACVQQCEVRKTACQDQCKARYDACAQGVEAQVQPRYEAQLKAYELELRRYAAALRHYEMQLQFDWMFSYPHRYSYWWDPWPGPYFPPPYREPVMPMREEACALPAGLRRLLRRLRWHQGKRNGVREELPAGPALTVTPPAAEQA